MSPEAISIKPSEMIEGGAVPVDQNLSVKDAAFCLFDYQGKAPPTTAARLTLVSDDGVESIQHFSAADPTRFVPSQDGKSLVAIGAATSLAKSSNFYVLMNNLVSAGFPENKLATDISVLGGLYAYWIGVPEPKRPGLSRTPEQSARGERIIPVPSIIHNLPWEKKATPAKAAAAAKASATKPAGAGAVAVAAAPAPAAEAVADDITAAAVDFIGKLVEESGSITRQEVAVRVFQDLATDPNRDALSAAIFAPATQGALVAAGYTVAGEAISK